MDILVRLLGLERYYNTIMTRLKVLERRITSIEQSLNNRWQS